MDDESVIDLAGNSSPTDRTVEARRILCRCEEIIERDLTPLQRRIFHLKHLRRQPIRAIAEALGKTEDAVKANLYRMRRSISDGAPGLEALLRS
jgi:DNA-directed RNA polymerase specialized sigma24 family protein